MTVFLMLLVALWGLCLVVEVIGAKATLALVWLGFTAFVLMLAWAIYDQQRGLAGVLAAGIFLVVVGAYILKDLGAHP